MQNFDRPLADLLHLFPALVLAAHLVAFTLALALTVTLALALALALGLAALFFLAINIFTSSRLSLTASIHFAGKISWMILEYSIKRRRVQDYILYPYVFIHMFSSTSLNYIIYLKKNAKNIYLLNKLFSCYKKIPSGFLLSSSMAGGSQIPCPNLLPGRHCYQ